MKIHIFYTFLSGPYGGGNQFLKALKWEFINMGVYDENPKKADVILFNSYPFREEYRFRESFNLKSCGKILIHRVDGPIFKIRNSCLEIDKIIYKFNEYFADGTIFQSHWSMEANFFQGMRVKTFQTVITNATDPKFFNYQVDDIDVNKKIKLIATSWSSNPRKGFKIYKYLDENLDFSKYEMTFVGNSPIKFKNIKHIKSVSSAELAKILKEHHIFITASQSDPCSNSLIEALHCGLPAVGLNDGGHPEIINKGGELFTNGSDVVLAIKKVVEGYRSYREKIDVPDISEVANQYYQFIEKVYFAKKNNLKIPSKLQLYKFLFLVYIYQLQNLLTGEIKKIIKNFS